MNKFGNSSLLLETPYIKYHKIS